MSAATRRFLTLTTGYLTKKIFVCRGCLTIVRRSRNHLVCANGDEPTMVILSTVDDFPMQVKLEMKLCDAVKPRKQIVLYISV